MANLPRRAPGGLRAPPAEPGVSGVPAGLHLAPPQGSSPSPTQALGWQVCSEALVPGQRGECPGKGGVVPPGGSPQLLPPLPVLTVRAQLRKTVGAQQTPNEH